MIPIRTIVQQETFDYSDTMIKPLPLYIGLRYIRAKRHNRFISFISLASTLGIAIGVAVLLTVLSVMNGFDEQIRNHYFAMTPQVTVSTEQEISSDQPLLSSIFKQQDLINVKAPFVNGEGMLIKGNVLRAVNVMGITPDQEVKISQLAKLMNTGDLKSLTSDSFNVIITQNLANQLNLDTGEPVNIFTSQATTTPLGLFPRYRQFNISGIYANNNSSLMPETVYISMSDADKLFAAGRKNNGWHLKLKNIYQASEVTQKLKSKLPAGYSVTDWTVQSGAFFQALAMEKTMMFIILLLIIAIAAFNLISMLIMVVNEKQADIAILRTLGATPKTIRNIFIIQGSFLGIMGTWAGLILGIVLTLNVTAVVNFLQQTFHVQFIPTSIYWSNYLPAKILFHDVIMVCMIAMGLSILASLYPALVAFRIQPAEALRYE